MSGGEGVKSRQHPRTLHHQHPTLERRIHACFNSTTPEKKKKKKKEWQKITRNARCQAPSRRWTRRGNGELQVVMCLVALLAKLRCFERERKGTIWSCGMPVTNYTVLGAQEQRSLFLCVSVCTIILLFYLMWKYYVQISILYKGILFL